MNAFGNLSPSEGDSNWISWAEKPLGTAVTGTIVHMWTEVPPFDGQTEECPHLSLAIVGEDEPQNLRCTQWHLRNQIIEMGEQLAVGDSLTITLSGMQGRSKLFTVALQKAATQPVAAAPHPQAAPAVAAQAPVGQAPPLA